MVATAAQIQERNESTSGLSRDLRPGEEVYPRQSELTTGLPDDLLRQWRWTGRWISTAVTTGRGGQQPVVQPTAYPGLHDLAGNQRVCLLNDLTNLQVKVQVRIDPERLVEFKKRVGEDADSLLVQGPPETTTHTPQTRYPTYRVTTEWQDFPALFASWLDYRQSEDPLLGAEYVESVSRTVLVGQNVAATRDDEVRVPQELYLAFRMHGDIAAGERAALAPPTAGAPDESTAELLAELAQMRAQLAALSKQQAASAREKKEVSDGPTRTA